MGSPTGGQPEDYDQRTAENHPRLQICRKHREDGEVEQKVPVRRGVYVERGRIGRLVQHRRAEDDGAHDPHGEQPAEHPGAAAGIDPHLAPEDRVVADRWVPPGRGPLAGRATFGVAVPMGIGTASFALLGTLDVLALSALGRGFGISAAAVAVYQAAAILARASGRDLTRIAGSLSRPVR